MRVSLLRQLRQPRRPPSLFLRPLSATATSHRISELSSQTQQQQPEEQQAPQPPPQDGTPSQPSPSNSNQPLIYPSAPSPHHTCLPTFLAYATRTNLDQSSTVYVGTHYEYTTSLSLARYGLGLRRVGGSSDFGIDLLGTWSLPSTETSSSSTTAITGAKGSKRKMRELKVLVQCKAVQRPGPHLIRELEGAFVGAPAGWRATSGVVGLLVTERSATKGIREALARSRWPMGFVACSREGKVEQFLWNRRAEEEGLEGLGVGMRYVVDAADKEGGRELVLTWKGRNLAFGGKGKTAG